MQNLPTGISEISVQELKLLIDRGTPPLLIDVREPHEVEIASLGGELIPLKTVAENLVKIPRDRPVVIYCRSGGRSGKVCEYLMSQGYQNVSNLAGGVLDWADKIDPQMTKY